MTQSPVNVIWPPQYAPGEGVAKALHSGIFYSKIFNYVGDDTSPVITFHVPAYTLITEVKVNVKTPSASGSASMTFGDSDDADRFMSGSDVGLATAGWKTSLRSSGSDQNAAAGYLYTKAIDLLATVTTTTGDSTLDVDIIVLFGPYADHA